MHEFSICRGLLDQVDRIVRVNGAESVARITLRIGPLSGVEIHLLERAFEAMRAESVVADAVLEIERTQVRVHCRACGAETAPTGGRLVCGSCGAHEVVLSQGDELMLKDVELVVGPAGAGAFASAVEKNVHV
jgi:hydrogenase nickel incorporation protein HypA/HybF